MMTEPSRGRPILWIHLVEAESLRLGAGDAVLFSKPLSAVAQLGAERHSP